MNPKRYEITVRKTVPATPERVWETWADPKQYDHIHGTHRAEIDFRVGGTIDVRFFEDRPGGETFVLLELDPPRKLVFAWEGHEENRVTLRLDARGEATEVSLTQDCHDDPGWIENCLNGWAWVLDSLDSYLTTGRGIDGDDWMRATATHAIIEKPG